MSKKFTHKLDMHPVVMVLEKESLIKEGGWVILLCVREVSLVEVEKFHIVF